MDKKKSILNVAVSVIFKLATIVMVILVRRCLIRYCGNEINGLNSLYLSIIGFLTVAELGVGSAITFCMYRPIVEGDSKKVSALYQLFRKWYLFVGAVILVCGFALTPFVHLFAKDYAQLRIDLYFPFVLMLISVVLTYMFGAKTALINAYKNNYITTAISSGGMLLQYVLQIMMLRIYGSFTAYLLCRIAAVLIQWVLTEWIVRRKHRNIITVNARLDRSSRADLSGKIRAMFMHNIGYLLVNTVDSVVISIFLGVAVLGKYANYTAIQQSIDSVMKLVFVSLTSVLGHLYVEKSRETTRKYHEIFHLLNFMIGIVFYLGYYAVIDDLIMILFGEELAAHESISIVITMNGFVQFMRNSTLTFRDATGTFYYDRWKPLVEGAVNITLSVIFVRRFGVVGVIAATIITNLLICHIVEPYVLYKHAFQESPRGFYISNYIMIMIFGCAMAIYRTVAVSGNDHWRNLFLNGMISTGISAVICGAVLIVSKDMRKVWGRRENGAID